MFFSCLAILEDETSSLYRTIAESVSNPTLKMLLNYLSEDSEKHRRICEDIAKICDEPKEIHVEKCQEMGGAFKESVDLTRSLEEKVQGGAPLIDVMQNLIGYEEKIGEEYLALLQTRAKRIVTKEYEIEQILKYVEDDEERHGEIVELIIGILKRAASRTHQEK